jgi:hypothetical protein
VGLESQLRVCVGASQAIENEVWTSLKSVHLTDANNLLADDVQHASKLILAVAEFVGDKDEGPRP